MRNFESIMKSLSLKSQANKGNLWKVYASSGESERLYRYEDLSFCFSAASPRTIETSAMFIYIPASRFPKFNTGCAIALEDFILRCIAPKINALNTGRQNINKDAAAKGEVTAQETNEHINRRNGMIFATDKNAFCLRLICRFPLLNGTWVNTKGSIRMVKELMLLVYSELKSFDEAACLKQLNLYTKQQQLRAYLRENGLCAFIADGSILPRENGTAQPMKNAVPFTSPDNMRITIPFSDGTSISGMPIKQGVTVITGGGYSGKSTLLNAIEMGIYNHIPGDGREFAITDNCALKIYAEDGRPVHNMDMSPFFKYLPNDIDIKGFSTLHASGSVSQAANIIEAVCGKCRLLLIDEDRSATNFMIRDTNMRKIVKREPIIPFTDRVRELYYEKIVSTILVIGGSSEYLSYADTVILMDNYISKDITAKVRTEIDLPKHDSEEALAAWMGERYLTPKETNQPFLYFRSISSENTKKIILDDYSADITMLTALTSENQLNSLAFMMEQLLTDKKADRADLIKVTDEIAEKMYSPDILDVMLSFSFKAERWFEAVRPIDIFCCANRMRGLNFKNKKTY